MRDAPSLWSSLCVQLDSLQQLHIPLILECNTPGRIEGQSPLPQPAAHVAFDAAQVTIFFLECELTLPAHVLFFVHQCPQVLLGMLSSN